jgi:hypothetical protein
MATESDTRDTTSWRLLPTTSTKAVTTFSTKVAAAAQEAPAARPIHGAVGPTSGRQTKASREHGSDSKTSSVAGLVPESDTRDVTSSSLQPVVKKTRCMLKSTLAHRANQSRHHPRDTISSCHQWRSAPTCSSEWLVDSIESVIKLAPNRLGVVIVIQLRH